MRVWRAVGCAGLVVGFGVGVIGCGGDDDDSTKKISASEVCGGVLSSHAAESLDFLTGSKEYDPYSGGTGLKETVAELEDGWVPGVEIVDLGVTTPPVCYVLSGETEAVADVRVDVSFTTARDADRKTIADNARYRVGRNAFAGSDWAYLYFDCVSPKLKGSTQKEPPIVSSVLRDGALSLHRNQPRGTQREIDEANLSVLNSAALKVAEKLDCENDGGLMPNPTFRLASDAQ